MPRNLQKGLTVLEILLATFLFFLLTVSFLTLRQRRIVLEPIRECVERKWQWMRMADEVEWRSRRWEIMAPPCLRVGFSPVETEAASGFPKVWDIETVSPLIKKMVVPNQYPVPPGHEFTIGQEVVICSDTAVARGTIKQIGLGTGRQSLVEVAPAGSEPAVLYPAGSFLVGVRPVVYETESVGPHQILYEKRSATERKPLGSGFGSWALVGAFDKASESVTVSLKMEAGECSFARKFPLIGQGGLYKPGRWWIREGELFFEPWVITTEEGKL